MREEGKAAKHQKEAGRLEKKDCISSLLFAATSLTCYCFFLSPAGGG